jgi:signal transduction histidine kinase
MKTTFSRTFFSFAVILLAALLLVGISFQLLVRNYLTSHAVEGLKADSSAIADVAAAYYKDDTLSSRDFLIILSVLSEVSAADTVICDANGRLLLCSDAPLGCEHQGLTITSNDYLQRILSQEYVVSNGIIDGLYDDARFVVSTTIRDHYTNGVLGIVIVSSPMAETLRVLKEISDTYIFVSVLAVLAAVVALTVYTRKSSTPLRDMAKTATAFGHGNLKARAQIPEGAPEEMQELALAFNNMAQSLEKSEYQRKEFVANVSHELKTPMTTIGGYVDGILDGTIAPEQQSRYLRIVSDETKRLSRLVRSMLDISQLQDQSSIPDEKKTCFDISECAGQVLITFERKILDKQLDVQVDIPEHPVMTFACQDYITQVIYNLVDNAVKFCPEGGTLGLQIRPGQTKLYVSVSNNGMAIPAKELPLLFDRFHKLDKSRSQNRDGWGLGLYIVKTLVCSHGEDISVSSTDEKTEFTFTLPIAN